MVLARFFSWVCVIAASLFAYNEVFGWGKEGHVIVAKLGETGLTPKTKSELKKLGFETIASDEVANYADHVRRNKEYPKYYNSGRWHYTTAPFGKCNSYDDFKKYTATHTPNVCSKINEYIAVLKDDKATVEDKREAVKFIVHFVGDIHQPMHSISRNDYGGNTLKIHYRGQGGNYLNLHHVWDTLLVKELGEPPATVLNLDKEVINPDVWAYESYICAMDCAYRVNGTSTGEFIPQADEPFNITDEYIDNAKLVVQLRMNKAGARLSRVLNNIFDPSGQ